MADRPGDRSLEGLSGHKFTMLELTFCRMYVIHADRSRAAREAGYTGDDEKDPKWAIKAAYKLMCKRRIQEEIQLLMNERAERTKIDADYVLTTIKKTIERCAQARPVMQGKKPVLIETPEGRIAPAYTFDAQGVLKGCEQLGRHLKLFSDKIEIEGGIEVNILRKRFDGTTYDQED